MDRTTSSLGLADPNLGFNMHRVIRELRVPNDEVSRGITPPARKRLGPAVSEALVQGYRVFVGEIAVVATAAHAPEAWQDFLAYLKEPDVADVCTGYTWFAGGWPDWWHDLAAPHFSVSPTDSNTFTGDTTNMDLIENDFAP